MCIEKSVIPIIFKTWWLFPFPYRFLFTLAKYVDNTWRGPFLGFKEQQNKTYFIVGGGKYYIAMRLWNIRKSVMQEGLV